MATAMVTVTEVMASTANSKRGPLFWACLMLPAMAVAGDWKLSSGVSVSERYTDNSDLNTSGASQSDWITEVSPRISVRRQGARLKVDADYSLHGLVYANDSDQNDLRHSLNGRANAELLEEWFFLDATARLSHELKSLGGGIGLGDPVGNANTTSVGAYSLSPYMKHRFGSLATVEARISKDGVLIGDSGVSDTNSTRYSLSATSGNHFYPLSWGATYDKSESNNSSIADTGSERASLNARYRLNKKWGLTAQAGVEKNDFTNASNTVRDYSYAGGGVSYTSGRRLSMDVLYNTSDNGNFVSGSVTTHPSVRTTVSANTTQRAYGRSYGMNLSHRTRHSNWAVSYQDSLTTSQQQYLNYLGSLNEFICSTGLEYYLPGVTPPPAANCIYIRTINKFSQVQINETYVAKNLIGTVSYNLRRNSWTLSVYDNKRELQGANGEDSTQGLQASWSLRPAPRTNFTLSAGLSQVESSGSLGTRQDDLWNIGFVASRQFQPKLTGSLELRHQERQSDQLNGDYSESSLAAQLNLTF